FFVNNQSVQSGANSTFTTVALSNNDKVKVRVKNSNNCVASSSEISMIVLIKVNAGTDQLNICGTSVRLQAIQPTTGGTWTATPASGSLDNANQYNTYFHGTIGTTYTLTWTVGNSMDQMTVSFNGDSDNDTVQDCNDVCPNADDFGPDNDGDTLPDACDCDSNNPNDALVTASSIGGFITTGTYRAGIDLTADTIVAANNTVTLIGGRAVYLKEGFHAQGGSTVHAYIEPCTTSTPLLTTDEAKPRSTNILYSPIDLSTINLTLSPNPFHSTMTITLQLTKEEIVELALHDSTGRKIKTLLKPNRWRAGDYPIQLSGDELLAGMYFVVLQTTKERLTKKVIKIE
ncbi:MAG: T9SS type A sorting domain-containing protein, partial [Bacteroidota bacterium]